MTAEHTQPPATVYYKFLDPGGRPRWGTGIWHLPDGGRPGEWMPEITGLVPGRRGYHVATPGQLVDWLGPELFEAECRGEHIAHGNVHVFGEARLVRRIDAWNDQTARLFGADCAERALPAFETCCPGDPRPRRAIEVARAFANGQATEKDLAAARAAAKAATRAASGRAAWDAARDAAWDAAWAAARVASRGPAWDAAWAASRAAANAATRDAARAAAVRDASGGAAWDAAWDAAWAAAWAAEREWQARRLFQLISAGHTQAREEEP